jgi:hypothetical protein
VAMKLAPGDLLLAKITGITLRPVPNSDLEGRIGWTKTYMGDLLVVIATGEPFEGSDHWRWYMLLHSPTMRYGWTTVSSVMPFSSHLERVSA